MLSNLAHSTHKTEPESQALTTKSFTPGLILL